MHAGCQIVKCATLPAAVDFREGFVEAKMVNIAGLIPSQEDLTVPLYLREAAVTLLQSLNSQHQSLLVEGPPGTGKSSLIWLWACTQAHQQNVLWLHVDRQFVCCTVLLANGTVTKYENCALANCHLEDIAKRGKVQICVVDGVSEENKASTVGPARAWFFNQLEQSNVVRLVVVASSQITVDDTDNFYKHSLPSWTVDEYRDALRNSQFRVAVRGQEGEEWLANRYFMAGGSARWMFGMTENEVRTAADRWIGKAGDPHGLLSGTVADKAQQAVNHLLMKIGGNVFIVSEYVARALAARCDMGFITEASRRATSLQNPAFDGWVFEMDFIVRVKTNTMQLSLEDNGEETYDTSAVKTFWDPTDLKNVVSKDWLLPERWNQGCYDAACLQDKCLLVFQVTRCKKHDLKLRYVTSLRDALVELGNIIEDVRICFVVPCGQEKPAYTITGRIAFYVDGELWLCDQNNSACVEHRWMTRAGHPKL